MAAVPQKTNCEVCRTLYGSSHRRNHDIDFTIHRAAADQLLSAVHRRCLFCCLLLVGIDKCIPRDERTGGQLVWDSQTITSLRWRGRSGAEFPVEFFTLPGTPSLWMNFPVATLPSGNTGSESSFRWIASMLRRCIETHLRCGRGLVRQLPRRVLRILPNRDLKLVETGAGTEPARYVCLSHRWNDIVISTTRANIDSFREGIRGTRFPRLWQDVVAFVQNFGIRYIWIDSLCIVQDDELDWRTESVKMATYYRNSYMTIAATKRSSSAESLYSNLQPEYHASVVRTRNRRGQAVDLHVRRRLNHCYEFETLDAEHSEFPLLYRAWVYQERLLSPRVIHFAQNEVIWECCEAACCECRPIEQTQEDFESSTALQGPPKMDFARLWDRSSTETQLQYAWRRVVAEYSGMRLTFEQDRLPAISGLAQIMLQIRNNDEYLAGLWRSSFVFDCLWSADALQVLSRPHVWRAPTWSWVSTESKITYWPAPMLPQNAFIYAKVISIDIQTRNASPTGEVLSGDVLIRSQLLETTITYFPFTQEELNAPNPTMNTFRYSIGIAALFLPDYGLGEAGPNLVESQSRIYCLRMARGIEEDYCLVLRAADSERYERIGLAQVKNKSAPDPFRNIPQRNVRII